MVPDQDRGYPVAVGVFSSLRKARLARTKLPHFHIEMASIEAWDVDVLQYSAKRWRNSPSVDYWERAKERQRDGFDPHMTERDLRNERLSWSQYRK